jgi:hypothetical protein
MGDIKSAAEIAREKLEKIGEPTPEERLKWKYVPEGEKLGARYLRDDNVNLNEEVKKYDDKARQVIANSVNEILLRNIGLPKNEIASKVNKKAMDGLKALKKDKVSVDNIYGRMRQVLDHYSKEGDKQKKQAYEALKMEFEQKMQQAIRQRTGVNANINIDVEKQPQFQNEWARVQGEIEEQYMELLGEYKKELAVVQ